MTSLATLTATTPGLPCRTVDPETFFSKDPHDRAHAISLCRTCPIRQACADYALEHRSLRGVWGGTTTRDRRQFWAGAGHRIDPQGRIRLECGSERAYRAHHSYRETPCDPCTDAHNAHVKTNRLEQLATEHAAGGSSRGYFIHLRLQEPVCAACKAAQARSDKARRARAREASDRARAAWDARRAAERAAGIQTSAQPLSMAG